jgi:hypothetical protein
VVFSFLIRKPVYGGVWGIIIITNKLIMLRKEHNCVLCFIWWININHFALWKKNSRSFFQQTFHTSQQCISGSYYYCFALPRVLFLNFYLKFLTVNILYTPSGVMLAFYHFVHLIIFLLVYFFLALILIFGRVFHLFPLNKS